MSPASLLSRISVWSAVAPLLAAVFAPFSILFDIPALTEPWFIQSGPNGLPAYGIPDPPASLALSAIGLGFNVCANALLLVRFSTSTKWYLATRMSVVFWLAKVIIAIVNICLFGKPKPGAKGGEGLWCAVVSLAISGLIAFVLVSHWVCNFTVERWRKAPESERLAVRIAGRHFMLNVTFFVIDLGLFALIASRVEKWTYFQGIYFVTVTYLTIGFGDFRPRHTVTRVLLVVFVLVGIAQLGNIVSMLVDFFKTRAAEKRTASRKKYERRRQEEEERRVEMNPDLMGEMDLLHHLGERQEARTRIIRLVKSLGSLVVFWVVGAAIFSQLEGWGYGVGLYFVYISFLTIGYGDYAPVTPAGRVVFVLYAIIAVPIMASFAVDAIQQIFSAFSARQYNKVRAKRGLEVDIEQYHREGANQKKIVSHAEFVEKWHRGWEEQVRQYKEEGSGEGEAWETADGDEKAQGRGKSAADSGEAEQRSTGGPEFDEDARLTDQILEFAISLEARARRLLIMHLSADGSKRGPLRTARILLKADRNVQLREVKSILKDIDEQDGENAEEAVDTSDVVEEGFHPALKGSRSASILKRVVQEDPDVLEFPMQMDDRETLQEVRGYREDFANLLAAGSRLMGLRNAEQALFERRTLKDPEKQELEGDAPQT